MLKSILSIGGDTETCEGEPFSFQFYGKDISKMVWVSSKTSTRKFLDFCDSLPEGEIVIWFHNLAFDLISLFHDRYVIFSQDEFSFIINGWNVSGIYANVRFAKLIKGNRVIHLLDIGAYFKVPLAKIAALHCPDLPKLQKPVGLGTKKFDASDTDFCAYAMRDSEITYVVGSYLLEQHQKYSIGLSVSAPHFAANVFRHKYMQQDIPLPKKGVIFASLHSYHGGKNNITVPYGFYEKVKLLDISSAYPAAMYELPSFYDADLYKTITGEGHPDTDLPRYGVYRVTGTVKDCKWPIIYDRTFRPVIGDFQNIWVTGPELNEALRSNEIKIERLHGYYYDASEEPDDIESPFKEFVDHFYNLKNEADKREDKINRDFYKLIMNSLYGKFIQSKGDKNHLGFYYDMDNSRISRERVIIAGGLFHPFIATLITGIVRAKIHYLEHKYNALHTATDGIFTTTKYFKEEKGLGGLHMEAYGDLLIFRNKLYILYGGGARTKVQSKVFKGKGIIKFALHGFNGSVFDLERIYVTGNPSYEFNKVNKLKESLRQGRVVNKFERHQGALNMEKIIGNGEETEND